MMAGGEAHHHSPRKEEALMERLDGDVAWLVSSFLGSVETTWCRASCRGCARTFERNCPSATSEYLYVESAERPFLTNCSTHATFDVAFDRNAHVVFMEEVPRRNAFSPLRCWELRLCWAGSLARCKEAFARRLFGDRDFVFAAIASASSSAAKEVSEKTKNNGAAVFEVAAAHLKRDRDVVFHALRKDGLSLQFVDQHLRTDRDVVLAAVDQNGWALQHVNAKFKKDTQVVARAVTRHPKALCLADEALRADPNIRAIATGTSTSSSSSSSSDHHPLNQQLQQQQQAPRSTTSSRGSNFFTVALSRASGVLYGNNNHFRPTHPQRTLSF